MTRQFFIKHSHKLVLLTFPFVLISMNSNWIFTPVTNYIPDAWFYLAYFRYFYDYAPVYPSNTHYFVERLTWNVPGYHIHEIFPPLIANHILHLVVYYVAVFSLYGILDLLFNRRTALITALCMGSYPWFLRAAGWDYPDGSGIAHMLLLIFLLTLAQYSTRWRAWLLLAGAVHSSLLITNQFWVGFFPSWLIYFLILNSQIKKLNSKELVLAASYFLLGNIVIASIAGLFYYELTGDYFFVANSIRSSAILTSDDYSQNNVLTIYGHLRPYWHILPIVIILVSTWRVWYGKRDEQPYSFTATYFLLIVAYCWLVFWHIYGIPLLNVFPYISNIIPAVFLVLGGLLSAFFDQLSPRVFRAYTAILIGLLLLPFALLRTFPGIESLQGNMLLIVSVSLIVFTVLSTPKSRMSALATAATLSMLFYLVSEKSYVYVSDPFKGRDNFMAIISASQTLDSYYPNHKYKDFRLWFRADENYDSFFSLASLYLYPWGSALGKPYSRGQPPTQLTLADRDILRDGDNIVIISSSPQAIELLSEANQSAYQQDAKLSLVTTKTIQQGSTRFFLYFTKVSGFQ